MEEQFTYLSSIALGIALSACCGFRIFIPLLAASLAGYFGWYPLQPGMQWLGSLPALICLASASLAEIAAYYIPWVDNLLDSLATPISLVAGTLLAYSILPVGQHENLLRWVLSFLAGGIPAGSLQMGTGILRLFSSKTTAGTGNVVLATGENLAAIAGSVFSFIIPLIISIILIIISLIVIYYLFIRPRKTRKQD